MDSTLLVNLRLNDIYASTEQYMSLLVVTERYLFVLAIYDKSITTLPTNFTWSGRLLEIRFTWNRDYFFKYCFWLRWYSISVVKSRVSFRSIIEFTARFLPTMPTEFLPFIVFHSTKKRDGNRRFTLAF